VKVHVSGVNTNACVSTAATTDDPPIVLSENQHYDIPITFTTDAFPSPHLGDPITLSKASITLAIPQELIQAGVDAGLVTDGLTIPSTAKFVLAGSNTVEGKKTFTVSGSVKAKVVGGVASPVVSTIALPDSVWHPKNDTDAVLYSEVSANILSKLNTVALGTVNATFDCTPSGNGQLVGVSGQGEALPTTTTVPTTDPGTVTTLGTTTPPTDPGTTGSGTLPRTGASAVLLLVISAMLIDVGLIAVGAGRRRLRSR